MSRPKFTVGEQVQVLCDHLDAARGQRVNGWLAGKVVQVDLRMAAVQFETDVFSINNLLIPNRTLWCAHGSRNIRRLESEQSLGSSE
jgi:hypothetical protein